MTPAPRASTRSGSDAATDGDCVAEDADVLRRLHPGGVLVDRDLATSPLLAGAGVLRPLSPYGGQTGAMWRSSRAVTSARVAGGDDADHVVPAARQTVGPLAGWRGAAAADHHPVKTRRVSTPATNGASA